MAEIQTTATKTVTFSEFKALVERDDWQREVIFHNEEHEERYDHNRDEDIPYVYGYVSKTSTLDCIKITHSEGYSYNAYDRRSFEVTDDYESGGWSIEGVVAIDDDGDEMCDSDLIDCLGPDFSEIDYDIDFDEVDNVDVDENSGMETFTLTVDYAPDLRFSGELVASAESSPHDVSNRYSGDCMLWEELALYKTKSGKFVCHRIVRKMCNSPDHFYGAVCDNEDEVVEFFGDDWLAEELYDEAGIDCSAADVE